MSKKVEIKSQASHKKARNRMSKTEFIKADTRIPLNLASFAKGKKFYIHTLGCQANIRDEEIMSGYLTLAGFAKTEAKDEADLAIINTCAVRENAEEKVYGEIGQYKAKAAKDKDFILAVCGCMMQEEGKADALKKVYPHVSLIFGTHNVHDILSLLEGVLEHKKGIIDVKSFPGAVVENMPSLRLDNAKAFVNISYGCDKFCTYCIVPYTRGKERSRHKEDIVEECRKLVAQGYKEITLLGQNVNSYGLDLEEGTTFAELLDEVASLGVPRLRFLTSYPSQFTDEMIEVMAKHDNITKFLHFPVQSGSSSMLRRMGRRYSREEYLERVAKIREKMPNIALTTDIIVGFPNETEEEFEETLSLCEKVRYSSAFTFIFSPRAGTPAAAMKDETDDVTKHERFNRLLKVIEKTTGEDSERMVGGIYEVLVEGPSKKDETVLTGYAENNKPVNFKGPSYLKGCLVKVKVNESHTYSLMGELVGDPLVYKAKDAAYQMALEPLFKEYLSLAESIDSSQEIKAMAKELEEAKKGLAKSVGDETKYEEAKARYQKAMDSLKSHPLIANRDAIMDSVRDELTKVREILG